MGDQSGKRLKNASNLCFACFSENITQIEYSSAFMKMMDLYFTALNVDVKPSEFRDMKFCEPCFDRILKFYDTNDTLIYFEKLLQKLQEECISIHLNSIAKRRQKKLPTLWHQNALEKEWKEKSLQGDALDNSLNQYDVTVNVMEPNGAPSGCKNMDSSSNTCRNECYAAHNPGPSSGV